MGAILSAATLLLAVSSVAVFAQPSPRGSLSGRLTDLYSRPLDGADLVLRNTATGAEARATSAKNGAYRFSGLAPGEYSLEAASPALGRGQLNGIFISSGREARVQAALELHRKAIQSPAPAPEVSSFSNSQPAISPASASPAALPVSSATSINPPPHLLDPPAGKPPAQPAPSTANNLPPPDVTMGRAAIDYPQPVSDAPPRGLSVDATAKPTTEPPALSQKSLVIPPPARATVSLVALAAPPSSAIMTKSVSAADLSSSLNAVSAPSPLRAICSGFSLAALAAAEGTEQVKASSPAPILIATQAIDSESPAPAINLSGEQLLALPLQGRRWENFVPDAQQRATDTADNTPDEPQQSPQIPVSVSIDGATTQLAFGGRSGGHVPASSLMGPGSSDAAIGEARVIETGSGAAFGEGANSSLSTHAAANGLHGQAFLFDRQNFLGAQNPFTQWIKETAPATAISTPVFAPLPFTPPDQQYTWGFGIGSQIHRSRFFWFAALDGFHRNNPGVATVKHPDNFFAQPSNDEMQVLSARLALSSTNPVIEGLGAYSGMLETLADLLGPAPRTSDQWTGFARFDWRAGERHHFTFEATGALWNSPGGGLARASQTYGNHSFGGTQASEFWGLGRWEAFLTPNLLAVTQGSLGRQFFSEHPGTPSSFEHSLNVNPWGQLPEMIVDSRYGYTIGNPAQFGTGSYPDEHLYQLKEQLDWVRGKLMVKAGVDWRHNFDATGLVRNHTGTYYYSSVENFISDALVFSKYGLTDALDPMNQHNCDQRGKAWRDVTGQLHGLGYLPCYSYYSQNMGPTNWYLSTNDVAGFTAGQWQPAHRFVLTASLRWQRQFLPPPIPLVNNPDLPLTQKLPNLGNEWAPRASFAWGAGESRWPVLRAGYGLYFARTNNAVLESALTQTGSLKGDLNFFMRPSDNLVGGGAPPFPYVLAGQPATVVKPAAVEFAPQFENPEIQQGEFTLEENLPGRVRLAASAIMSLGRRLPVSIDTNFDPAANPGSITYAVIDASGHGPIKSPQITVPFFAAWPSPGSAPTPAGRLDPNYQQITVLMSRANSTYEAAILSLSHYARRGFSFHARYTYAHAMDWNPNESAQVLGSSVLDPTNFSQEYGTSSLDIRHSASSLLIWDSSWKLKGPEGLFANDWMVSGIGQYHSGLPYTMRTAGSIPMLFETTGATIIGLGPGMNGSGGDNRVYGVGRNTYRYPYTWRADLRLAKKFNLRQMRELELMAESFNFFNHQNVTQLETTGYYISSGSTEGSLPTLNFLTGLKTGQTEFGKPLDINATDSFRPRQFDFGFRMRF